MKTKGFTIAALSLVALGVIVPSGMAPRLAGREATRTVGCDGVGRARALAKVVKWGARAVVWMAQP